MQGERTTNWATAAFKMLCRYDFMCIKAHISHINFNVSELLVLLEMVDSFTEVDYLISAVVKQILDANKTKVYESKWEFCYNTNL